MRAVRLTDMHHSLAGDLPHCIFDHRLAWLGLQSGIPVDTVLVGMRARVGAIATHGLAGYFVIKLRNVLLGLCAMKGN